MEKKPNSWSETLKLIYQSNDKGISNLELAKILKKSIVYTQVLGTMMNKDGLVIKKITWIPIPGYNLKKRHTMFYFNPRSEKKIKYTLNKYYNINEIKEENDVSESGISEDGSGTEEIESAD